MPEAALSVETYSRHTCALGESGAVRCWGVDDQGQLAKGVDPQLEAAIEAVLGLIEANPPFFADPPAYEVR